MIPATLHSEEAERAAVGTMLLKPELVPETLGELREEDLTSERIRRFFRAAKTVFMAGGTVEQVSVLNALREAGELKPGDATYLAALTDFSFIPGTTHCQTVSQLSRTRSFLSDLDKARTSLRAGANLESVIEIFAPALQKTSGSSLKVSQLGDTAGEELQKILRRAENGGRLPGISTGFPDLDNITGGLISSNLIVLAARPSMGKTTLALNIAEEVASTGAPVAFFSMEMSRSELTEKLFARRSRVPLQKLREGSFTVVERDRIEFAAQGMKSIPLFLYDRPSLSIPQVVSAAKGLQMRHGLALLVIDYLQLMRGAGQTREQEVASLSRGLKSLAMELQIPIIALSQLNRGLEGRNEKRPSLADLRDSGAIEQDANIVIFIYRDEIYNPSNNNPQRGIAELIVAKNRSGATGTAKLSTTRLSYSEFTALSLR